VNIRKYNVIFYDVLISNDLTYIFHFINELKELISIQYSRKLIDRSQDQIIINDLGGIILILDQTLSLNGYEGYLLEINEENIKIIAQDFSGIHNGIQTLLQIISLSKNMQNNEDIRIPGCKIRDWSSFKYRGFMDDVGRNFQSIESLKKQIKIFSHYKINLYHWHLTDNPAWRIESKIYPQLNDPKNHRQTRDPGKFYTFEEIRDFITYCRSLNVLVIPEIDIPGHSKYFKKAMNTYMFTKKGQKYLLALFNEFFAEIPIDIAPYIHIGSDEVHIPFPKRFIKKFTRLVKKNNRDVIMWNPGLPIPPYGIAHLWAKPKKIIYNQKKLDSRGLYLNNCDPLSFIVEILAKNPCDKIQGDATALGSVICLWPDVNVDEKSMIAKTNPIYSSIMALTEICWQGRKEIFEGNPMTIINLKDNEFESFAKFEDNLLIHRKLLSKDFPIHYIKQRDIKWKLIGPFEHAGNTRKSFPVEKIIQDQYKINDKNFLWIDAIGGTINLKDRYGKGGHFPESDLGTVYAITYIKTEKDRDVKFWIGFEMVCRSNRQYRGVPDIGLWDANGGDIWINNKNLIAPNWENPNSFDNHKKATWHTSENERPFIEEEFYWLRDPTFISLKKGWNKVLVRVPYSYKRQNWQFTFIPVEIQDNRYVEVEDLMFSNDLKHEEAISNE
jgi:hexosaminidase